MCCFSRFADNTVSEKITLNGDLKNCLTKFCSSRSLGSLSTLKTPLNFEREDNLLNKAWKGELLAESFPMSHDYSDMFALYFLKVRDSIASLKNRQICQAHFELFARLRKTIACSFLKSAACFEEQDADFIELILGAVFSERLDKIIVNDVLFDLAVTKYEKALSRGEKSLACMWLFQLMKPAQAALCIKQKLIKKEDLSTYALRLAKHILAIKKSRQHQVDHEDLKVLSLSMLVCPSQVAVLSDLRNSLRENLSSSTISKLDLKSVDNQSWLYYLTSVTNLYLHHASDEELMRELISIGNSWIEELAIETQQMLVITLVQQRMRYPGLESEAQRAIKNRSHVLLSKSKYFNGEVLSGRE